MKIFNNVFRDKCIKCNRKRLVNKKVYVSGVMKQKRRKRKMLYDMKAHAPQLMETLLSSFSSGDGDTLVRTKKMLTQVYKNTDVDKDLMAVEEAKKKRYKELEADVTKKLNDAVKKKNLKKCGL